MNEKSSTNTSSEMEPTGSVSRIRRPVQREGAEKYLLINLLSFAASVSFTRLFLELTGYPQVGNDTLHVAHVLWGGLLLYIATLLPLLWSNRWVYQVVSILSGLGIGLFIDEVGKFITQTNDYFFPPAAPIIYAFFLLTVLLYIQVRRPRTRDVRSELYCVLDGLEEVLDHDLSDRERSEMIKRLDSMASETTNPDLLSLIQANRQFIAQESLYIAHETPSVWQRTVERLKNWEARWITPRSYRAILAGSLVAMALWALYYPIVILVQAYHPDQMAIILVELIQAKLVDSRTGLNWFEARLALQSAVGVILLLSAAFLITHRVRRGIEFAYLGLLLSLTTVNLLMFYFDQFSSIISASIQFVMLLGVLYFRRHYLPQV